MIRRRPQLVWAILLLVLARGAAGAGSASRLAQLIDNHDVEAIRAMGSAVLPELAKLYESGTTERKTAIASLFYQLGWRSPEAERAMIKDVRSSDGTLRVNVQYALGRVSDDPQVVDTLLDIMQHDREPFFRDKAACALAYDQTLLTEAQKVRLYDGLIDALAKPEPQVQMIAIQALKVLTGQNKGFRLAATPAEKRQSIEAWKRWLAEYRANL